MEQQEEEYNQQSMQEQMSVGIQQKQQQKSFNIKDGVQENKNQTQQDYRLKLSIDIRQIKNQIFTGTIYAKYQGIAEFNIQNFRTNPAVEITNPNVEHFFKNGFKSYTFDIDMNKLYNKFKTEQITIEIWHQDRLSKDFKIGATVFEMARLLTCPVTKTQQSYARVLDQFLPVDQYDEEGKPIKRVADLRVISYLEDLGPSEVIRQKERQLGLEQPTKNYGSQQQQQQIVQILPNQNGENGEDPERNKLLQELNSLEYKIVWELETWKKAEEAKFKIQLKHKEIEFLNNLTSEWKNREIEKERFFKQSEQAFILAEQKLRQKAADLQKRENKIVFNEEILERETDKVALKAAADIKIKTDEIVILQRKLREETATHEKEKLILETELEKYKQKLIQVTTDFDKFRKDQENSPMQVVQNDLTKKRAEITELQKQLEKAHELKEQYKVYYEKLRTELVKQKKQFDDFKEQQQAKNNSEMELLRNQITELINKQNQQQQTFQQENMQPNNFNYTNQKNNNFGNNQNTFNKNLPSNNKNSDIPSYNWDKNHLGELERLIQERDYLLQTGDYDEDDPLVQELNNQIRQLR